MPPLLPVSLKPLKPLEKPPRFALNICSPILNTSRIIWAMTTCFCSASATSSVTNTGANVSLRGMCKTKPHSYSTHSWRAPPPTTTALTLDKTALAHPHSLLNLQPVSMTCLLHYSQRHHQLHLTAGLLCSIAWTFFDFPTNDETAITTRAGSITFRPRPHIVENKAQDDAGDTNRGAISSATVSSPAWSSLLKFLWKVDMESIFKVQGLCYEKYRERQHNRCRERRSVDYIDVNIGRIIYG